MSALILSRLRGLHIVTPPTAVVTVLTPEFLKELARRNASIRALREQGYRVDPRGSDLCVSIGLARSFEWLFNHSQASVVDTRKYVYFMNVCFLFDDCQEDKQ